MSGFAFVKYYFELLPRDLTGDYTRMVLSCQSKGAEGTEVEHTYNQELFVDQSWQLLQNGRGSKKAKLRIGRAYGKAIGSHCVKPIHDLSAADPFAEMTRFAMFEFGHCNL